MLSRYVVSVELLLLSLAWRNNSIAAVCTSQLHPGMLVASLILAAVTNWLHLGHRSAPQLLPSPKGAHYVQRGMSRKAASLTCGGCRPANAPAEVLGVALDPVVAIKALMLLQQLACGDSNSSGGAGSLVGCCCGIDSGSSCRASLGGSKQLSSLVAAAACTTQQQHAGQAGHVSAAWCSVLLVSMRAAAAAC